ncbi:2Fe-2S iron-sulfur cluster-binding protein [Streptomyces sp. NPDC020996]|uniref:2Fe-2S iron-sulfur cluster-binding protein n=1 Tax=Streptomyces sp. NPDC020996 TaxID=3154791 RepID=UPI0033FC1EB3
MTDDQHGQDAPQGGAGRWDPLPQGDYDDGATAFVKLPEGGIDELLAAYDTPLAAPGHGYVPPQITATPAPGAGDPAAPGAWAAPADGAPWPDPNAAAQGAPDDRFTYHPGATQQWNFGDNAGHEAPPAPQPAPAPAPGQDVTGEWSIPVAGGDLPDESGEFTTSSLVQQWGGTPPATLPGGAPAPWATEGAGQAWGAAVEGATDERTAPHADPRRPHEPYEPHRHPGHAQPPGAGYAQPPVDAGYAYGTPAPGHDAQPAADSPAGHTPAGHDSAGHDSAGHAPAGHDAAAPEHPAHEHPAASGEQEQDPGSHAAAEAARAAQVAEAVQKAAQRAQEAGEAAGAAEAAQGAAAASEGAVEPFTEPAGEQPAEEPPAEEPTPGEQPAEEPSAGEQAGPADEPAATAQENPEADGPPQAPSDPRQADSTDQADQADHADGTVGPAGPADAAATDDGPAPVPTGEEHPLASYVLRVNGADRPVADAWIGESLLYVLRERLGLAGAKDGCSQGECGACSVQVDGRLVASCLVPAVTAAGSEVRTVEGLAVDGQPSDVQRALARCGAVQCGFCVPGMAMTVHDLLEGNPAPTELETRQALCGNLCRCSGYRGVVDAVQEVVAEREAHSAADDATDHQAKAETHAGTHADEARIPHQAGPGAGGVNPSAFESPGSPGSPGTHDQAYGQDGGQA